MSEKRSVTATREEQLDALEDAFELVEEDVEAGLIDARTWGESVPDGEKLRIVSEAFAGRLEFNGGDLDT